MKEQHFNVKKGFIIFHIFCGVLALFSIILFIKSGKHSWMYKLCLLSYICSGAAILTLFFTTLPLFQRLYFEVLFAVPLLLMAFWFLTWLFEYAFFGK
jgi:hypothetical protein